MRVHSTELENPFRKIETTAYPAFYISFYLNKFSPSPINYFRPKNYKKISFGRIL